MAILLLVNYDAGVGYRLYYDTVWNRFEAGCRYFTPSEALEHWRANACSQSECDCVLCSRRQDRGLLFSMMVEAVMDAHNNGELPT